MQELVQKVQHDNQISSMQRSSDMEKIMSQAAERVTKVGQKFSNQTNICSRSKPRSLVKFESAAKFDCKQNEKFVHYVDKLVNKVFTSHNNVSKFTGIINLLLKLVFYAEFLKIIFIQLIDSRLK